MGIEPVIVVHGGAGFIAPNRLIPISTALRDFAIIGYENLKKGASALSAVEDAVKSMELNVHFNAGYGAVLNWDGNIELEASIMHGKDLKAGCVALLKDIKHPISVARKVLEQADQTFMGGNNAMLFAKEKGFEILPEGSLVTDDARRALADFKMIKSRGTPKCEILRYPENVGAVALDKNGNIAVAASAGGVLGKLPGQIGHVPVLGCGIYADDNIGGVSTTGYGNTIIMCNLAQRIIQRMNFQERLNAQVATEFVVNETTARMHDMVGAVAIDRHSNVGVHFTSRRMTWCSVTKNTFQYGTCDAGIVTGTF